MGRYVSQRHDIFYLCGNAMVHHVSAINCSECEWAYNGDLGEICL